MRLIHLFLLIATMALTAPAIAAPAAPANADSEVMTRKLIDAQGCRACHRIDGTGAGIGPDLAKVGSRLTRDQLHGKLANPQKRHANGRIADFSHLRKEELDALTAYLSTRK